MWNSTSVQEKYPVGVLFIAGAVIFQTHMGLSGAPSSYNVFHDQSSSNYDNGRWTSSNFNHVVHSSEKQSLIGIADIIAFVKVSLGLPNKDVASIFGVTRQTLHAYVTEEGVTQSIKSSTRERMINLHEIIKEISKVFPHSPGAMSKNFTLDGCSLLDLLMAETLDIMKIVQHSKSLAERMSKIPSSSSKDDSTLFGLTRSV